MLPMLRRLLAIAVAGAALALSVVAFVRPYADNQRNWLVTAAVIAGLTALSAVASPSVVHRLGHFWRKVRSEWSNGS